ncbi:MAG: hypothetical protein QOG44_3979 [Acidimicrobiaceae bacterium]|nr:hypothetical protein [Acidimicrobiaceae bacterium]
MGVSAGPLVPGWSGVVNNGGRTRTPPGLKLSQRRRKNHAKCRDHRDGSSRCCNLGDRSDARCVAPGCSALPDDAQDVVSTGEPALPFGDGQHSCPWRSHPRWARHASPPLPRLPAARSIRPSGSWTGVRLRPAGGSQPVDLRHRVGRIQARRGHGDVGVCPAGCRCR